MIQKHACVIAAALSILGCAGYQPTPTSEVFTGSSLYPILGSPKLLFKSLVTRAPFDLDCPEDKLTYKALGGASVGVSGCDRRGTYKYLENVGWVMNAAGESTPASSEPASADPANPP